MKRGLCILIVLLCSSFVYAGITSPNPETLYEVPRTLQLIYSAPVTINDVVLYTYPEGELVSGYVSELTPTGESDTFTITTGRVPEGDYKLVINKSEGNPPKLLPDDIVPFTYEALSTTVDVNLAGSMNKLFATPAANSPTGNGVLQTGFANATPYIVEFSTTKPAACMYALTDTINTGFMGAFQVTGTFPDNLVLTHRITGLSSPEYSVVSVYCNTSDDENSDVLKQFTLGYENRPPTITATLDPPLLVDPNNLRTNITLASGTQKVYCEAEGDGIIATSTDHYNVILDSNDAGAYLYSPWIDLQFFSSYLDRAEENFTITCTNRAGLSTTKNVTIIIDPTIEPSLAMETPGRYTRETNPVLGIKAVRESLPVQSNPCVFTDGTAFTLVPDTENVVWSTLLNNIVDGDYNYSLRCNIGGGILVEETFDITVDRKAPPSPGLHVPPYLCEDPLYADLNLSKYQVPDPNFNGYLFNITYATGGIVLEAGHEQGGETTTLLSSIETETNETYHWHIWPVDLAGNKALELTGSTLMIEEGDKLCDNENPTGWLEITKNDTGTIVLVKCKDDESGCASTFSYNRLGENDTADLCTYAKTETLNRSLTFYEVGSVCYKVKDLNDNEDTGFRVIDVSDNVPSPAEHCDNGVLDAGLETDIDCGGQCDACEIDEACVVGDDCKTDYCGEGDTCEEKGTCTDAIKNGFETAADCGGVDCPTCGAGQACTSKSDCTSDYCDTTNKCGEKPLPKTECTSNSDCDYGKVCEGTYCVTPPATKCEDDTDCDLGEECDIYGECAPIPAGEKASLLGIILIILGLLIMAGSGYWLYTLHQEREMEQPTEQPVYRQQPQELSPAQRIALQKQRQAQLEAIKQRKALGEQRLAEKSKKRAGLADAFGKEEETAEVKEETSKETSKEKKLDDGSTAEFVDVRDLGKKEKKFTPKAKTTEEPIKKTDSFDDLDKITGKSSKEDTFKELDEVIKEKDATTATKAKGAKDAK